MSWVDYNSSQLGVGQKGQKIDLSSDELLVGGGGGSFYGLMEKYQAYLSGLNGLLILARVAPHLTLINNTLRRAVSRSSFPTTPSIHCLYLAYARHLM